MLMTPPIGALGGLILSGLAFGSVSAARTAHPSKSSGWFDGLIQHDNHQHKHQISPFTQQINISGYCLTYGLITPTIPALHIPDCAQ